MEGETEAMIVDFLFDKKGERMEGKKEAMILFDKLLSQLKEQDRLIEEAKNRRTEIMISLFSKYKCKSCGGFGNFRVLRPDCGPTLIECSTCSGLGYAKGYA